MSDIVLSHDAVLTARCYLNGCRCGSCISAHQAAVRLVTQLRDGLALTDDGFATWVAEAVAPQETTDPIAPSATRTGKGSK